MDIKNVSESYNPVFKRKEILFFIYHSVQGSPKLYDARKSLVEKYGVDESSVYMIKLETRTGTNRSYGEAEIYESPKTAARVVPKHIQTRNTPTRREKKAAPVETPKGTAKGEKK